MATGADRVPPQNIDAERSVLGAMLLDNEAIIAATDVLVADDFYREAHAEIFRVITDLADEASAVDSITVTDALRDRNQLEKVGGVAYVTDLANAVPTTANVEHYARIVEEKAIMRKLLRATSVITQEVYDGTDDVEALMDKAEALMFEVAEKRRIKDYTSLRDLLMDTTQHIENLHRNKGAVIGVPTGFKELDQMTSGFHPSELVILAARPSVGKTTLALNIVSQAALEHDIPVAFFSLEMSGMQLAQRLLCAEAHVDAHRLRTGYVRDEEWPRISQALGRLSEASIFVDDTPNQAIMDVRSRARRLKAEHDVGLVVVDYLQLMYMRGRVENRQQEISTISRHMKAMARELDVPVLALSQLSRAVEQRQSQRPQLSDLRESGALEQDADVVMFIYNEPETENDQLMEIVVAKQRNGPVGDVELVFLRDTGIFADPTWRGDETDSQAG